jgi:hypothetical protein
MKTERKKLIKKLDKVFGDYIKKRDNYTCVLCGSKERVQCGHLLTRAAYSTRWDEEGCFAQCFKCNYTHEFRPYPFYQWFIKKFGQEKLDDLYFRHKQVVKFKNFQLEELIEKYSKKIQKTVDFF